MHEGKEEGGDEKKKKKNYGGGTDIFERKTGILRIIFITQIVIILQYYIFFQFVAVFISVHCIIGISVPQARKRYPLLTVSMQACVYAILVHNVRRRINDE